MDEQIYLTPDTETLLQGALDFVRNNGAALKYRPGQRTFKENRDRPGPRRAILMQNLYGGSQALAQVCSYQEETDFWLIEVLGINPVADSSFKIVFSLQGADAQGNAIETEVFRTPKIPVVIDPDTLRDTILTASGGFFTYETLKVSIGNPFESEDLVQDEEGTPTEDALHDDIVPADDTIAGDLPKSYVGAWLLQAVYNGPETLLVDVIEDPEDDCFMRGLSVAAVQKMADVPTNEYIYVRDVFNLAKPNPARAGVKVGTLWFPDAGDAVFCIGYRDIQVDLGSVAAFEDPPTV